MAGLALAQGYRWRDGSVQLLRSSRFIDSPHKRDKAVPLSGNGLDETGVVLFVSQRHPHLPNGLLNGVTFVMLAPNCLEKFRFRNNPTAIPY
jgi:hypothetical protein